MYASYMNCRSFSLLLSVHFTVVTETESSPLFFHRNDAAFLLPQTQFVSQQCCRLNVHTSAIFSAPYKPHDDSPRTESCSEHKQQCSLRYYCRFIVTILSLLLLFSSYICLSRLWSETDDKCVLLGFSSTCCLYMRCLCARQQHSWSVMSSARCCVGLCGIDFVKRLSAGGQSVVPFITCIC